MTEIMTESKLCIVGVDEVGRGPLAGPVVAAAVILPCDHALVLNDSKTLSARKRSQLSLAIREQATAYALGEASVAEIDQINIL